MTVSVARTAAPPTSPVDASTPEGTSTETTGAPAALTRSIVAAASSTRLAVESRPEERVDDHVGLLDCGRLDRVAAFLAQDPSGDPAVAAVRAAAADDGDPARIGEPLHHLARDRRTRALHQLRDLVALLRRPRLLGRVERVKHR